MDMDASAPGDYLGADDIIDHSHPAITDLACSLRARHPGVVDFARAAFEHVRDEIAHSWDVQDPRVTVRCPAERQGLGGSARGVGPTGPVPRGPANRFVTRSRPALFERFQRTEFAVSPTELGSVPGSLPRHAHLPVVLT